MPKTSYLPPQEKTNLNELYAAMRDMRGICKDNVSDASITIDEVLYGESGVWRRRVNTEHDEKKT